jgi:hypothetical protein
MRLAVLGFVIVQAGFMSAVEAQTAGTQCGPACQKCADELGYPRDAQGRVMFRGTRASGTMAWERCLEEKRQAMRNGKL